MKKMFIYGTRPDCIKLAPLMNLCSNSIIVNTGQHSSLPLDVLSFFNISDTYNLQLMTEGQTLESFASKCLLSLSNVIKQESPDLVIVQGDTSTAAMGALAASYSQVSIAHVEAGMRTDSKYAPFPEEINRTLIDSIVDYAFCPTNLDTLNITSRSAKIFITGNTSIDALCKMSPTLLSNPFAAPYVLVTCHRRESHGEPLLRVVEALLILANTISQKIIFIAHPNPNIQKVIPLLDHPNIIVKSALNYLEMLSYIKYAELIITDSGGLQEEAPALGKKVIYLREVTEAPHLSQWIKLVGTNVDNIVEETTKHLGIVLHPFSFGQNETPSQKIARILESL